MVKHTLKNLRGEHRNVFNGCLTIFQHYTSKVTCITGSILNKIFYLYANFLDDCRYFKDLQRVVFRTQSNNYENYLSKKSPSYMFLWVVNTSLLYLYLRDILEARRFTNIWDFQTISFPWSLSRPPENNRKPLVFWCFQGVQKETSDIKRHKEYKILQLMQIIEAAIHKCSSKQVFLKVL